MLSAEALWGDAATNTPLGSIPAAPLETDSGQDVERTADQGIDDTKDDAADHCVPDENLAHRPAPLT